MDQPQSWWDDSSLDFDLSWLDAEQNPLLSEPLESSVSEVLSTYEPWDLDVGWLDTSVNDTNITTGTFNNIDQPPASPCIPNHSMSDSLCALTNFDSLPTSPIISQASRFFSNENSEPKANSAYGSGRIIKPKIESSQVVFSLSDWKEVKARKRRPFKESRRKQVALNRVVGVCIQCKLRKVPCSMGIPCDACIKRVGSATLGQELCTRNNLVATRFNNIDLLEVTKLRGRLERYHQPLMQNTQRQIYLTCTPCCPEKSKGKQELRSSVQDFLPVPGSEEKTICDGSQTIRRRRYNDCEVYRVQSFFCAIPEHDLPSIELLRRYCTDVTHYCGSDPFVELQKAFTAFAQVYSEAISELPLKSLIVKIMRMKATFNIYRKGAHMRFSDDTTKSHFTSSWMTLQIRYLAGSEIARLEAEILDEFDRLISRHTIGKRNTIATWVGLWLLLLIYKEQMSFVQFHYLERPEIMDPLFGLAKHLYNILLVVYVALYKTTSPLLFDSGAEDVREMLDSHMGLIRLFTEIQAAMYKFHSRRELLTGEDSLFMKYAVDNEIELLRNHERVARKRQRR